MGEITELRNLSFNKTPRQTDHSGRGFGKGLVRSRSATAHCSLDGFTGSEDDDEDDDAAFFEVCITMPVLYGVSLAFYLNRTCNMLGT
jgi:hypothetical protein